MSKPPVKNNLHPNNPHNKNYDLQTLATANPALKNYIKIGKAGNETITFSDAKAVKELNRALLFHYYELTYWDIPEGYLCPPVPGRADYILYIHDLLESKLGQKINCLDIGTGANLIYPIIASKLFDWKMVGSELDSVAIASAQQIIDKNETLKGKVDLRKQSDSFYIFKDIIREGEFYDVCICNPPFYKSAEEANKNNRRKQKGLGKNDKQVNRNFEGQPNELWTEGGEKQFLKNMIYQSEKLKSQVGWFTSLVSRETHLQTGYRSLERVKATDVKTIDTSQGNKKSRILAWRY